ncbi:transglycosylase [Aureimonas flava]|uniref:peptidoglycan lytic exotransglycosylase n=1 Tax=Aureimonas flava TaxID=2320271 RepID=A0A3A1WQY0_9HYPH|nr:MltA domain-containing protein [Aureimonas flava]RIY02764.1 transglycosylase [Aureimonas flava]
MSAPSDRAEPREGPSVASLGFAPLGFDRLTHWGRADHRAALHAFRRSAPSLLRVDPAAAAGPLRRGRFAPAARAVLEGPADPSRTEARLFFERFFRPAEILSAGAPVSGFVTGYYEPELPASRRATPRFRVPLYRRPADLVAVADDSAVAGLEPDTRFALRAADGRLLPYPDRAAIEGGWLRGRGLELAFLEKPVDAFFVHVQGSARLALPGGETMRVGYAAKNGHRFTAIGRVLVQAGELPLEGADMAGIRRWLAAHPDRADALLHRNRSFIFFREVAVEPGAGPVGGAGVPLTPFGSLAVDAGLHAYGMPVFVEAPELAVSGRPFRRLLVAQDTGSAIVGPARGDIFTGSGDAAGRVAGAIRHRARWLALLPVEARP